MTEFDFDAPIDRRDVPALKVHPMVLGDAGAALFAGGVADMDFKVAPAILSALQTRLDHGVFGYEAVPDTLLPALQGWLACRHDWHVDANHILRAPNALNSLAIAVSLFSEAGDGVIVQPPVFFDFFDVICDNDRKLVRNPLVLKGGRYGMDFEGLEKLARDPANSLLLLCNPHNPIGRVWSREELGQLHEICLQNDVLVVADELHGDIIFPGHRYVPYASLGPQAAGHSITVLSPAKSFNIAGCCSAFTVVPDEVRREAFQAENSRLTVNKNNAFANVAMEAAFREGGPWLEAVIGYLEGNLALVREAICELGPVRLIEPEGTFLVWLEFRELNLAPSDLHAFLKDQAGLALTRGTSFGPEGAGFMRMNIACRGARLRQALESLRDAVERL